MWQSNMSRYQGLGIAVLRISVGILFAVHGWQKVFDLGVDQIAGMFEKMEIPYPNISARLVSFSELLGGAALVLGLFTRLAVIPLAIIMIVAITRVHWPHGFFNMNNGYEFPMTLLAAHIALFFTGGGWLSADWVVGKCCKKKPTETLPPVPSETKTTP